MSIQRRRLNLRSAGAALALLGLTAALAGPALAATVIHFQRESYLDLLGQLRRGEVHAVVLHPQGYKAHVSLDGGGHMTVTYPPSEVARLEAQARAHGASFAVATATPKAVVHHKLRYIAGAVLIVVILVVLAVLLVGRRRAITDEEDFPRDGETTSAPGAPGPS